VLKFRNLATKELASAVSEQQIASDRIVEESIMVQLPNQNNYRFTPFRVGSILYSVAQEDFVLRKISFSAAPFTNFAQRRVFPVFARILRGISALSPVYPIPFVVPYVAATHLPFEDNRTNTVVFFQNQSAKTFSPNVQYQKGQKIDWEFFFEDTTAGSGVFIIIDMLIERVSV